MWRLIPLLKMTLRMFIYSAVVFTVAHGLNKLLFICREVCISGNEALVFRASRCGA